MAIKQVSATRRSDKRITRVPLQCSAPSESIFKGCLVEFLATVLFSGSGARDSDGLNLAKLDELAHGFNDRSKGRMDAEA